MTVSLQYKAYVASGRAEKEKRECGTPPPEEQKKNKLKKAIDNWRISRAKRRWQKIAQEEDGTGFGHEYELEYVDSLAVNAFCISEHIH